MRAQDRARPDQDQAHDPQVGAGPAVTRPPDSGGYSVQPEAAAPPETKKPDAMSSAAQRQQPERQRVDPRERHVRRADLERHRVVPEARQDRDDEQEQHEAGVHRERLVVELASSTIWSPGCASSRRTTSARRPPAKKKTSELIRYRIPIFLWSVVVSHAYRPPRTAGAAGCRAVVAIRSCSLLDREGAGHVRVDGADERDRCRRRARAPGSAVSAGAGRSVALEDLRAATRPGSRRCAGRCVVVLEVDRERRARRRLERPWSRTAMFCARERGRPRPAGAPDGGGAGRLLGLLDGGARARLSNVRSQASKVGGRRVDVEQHRAVERCRTAPRTGRGRCPASSIVKSNVFSFPGTTSRLNRNFGT